MSVKVVEHQGSCHCGAVKWIVTAPEVINVIYCNCSICNKKGNDHFIVASSCFRLLQGGDSLTTYTFNTHTAKHKFCKTCGVQSFYIPRSNPNDIGVNPRCIDSDTVKGVNRTEYDGLNWEKTIKTSAPVAFVNE